MAAVAVVNDSVRLHDMGDVDGNSGISNLNGSGAAGAAEPDFAFQGANSFARKIGTTRGAFQVDTSGVGGAADMTTTDRSLWLAKLIATNKDALLALGAPAMDCRIGSDSGNYYENDIAGGETEFYPPRGGWLLIALNPNLAEFQSAQTGTPVLSGVDYFAMQCDFSGTSKAPNVGMDAIDVGLGLTLIGGDGGSTDGVFDDFVVDDQGSTTSGRFGYITELDSIIFVLGKHWIGRNASGTTTSTSFTDIGRVLTFPDSLHGPGDQGFNIDLTTVTPENDVTWTSCTFLGIGTGNRIRFNTETEIDGVTLEEVTSQSVIDAFRPGDSVVMRSQGGTETPGVTDGTRYWVGKDLTATPTGITFHTTRTLAMLASGAGSGGSPVNLTASTAGNGEIWRIDKDNDRRPELTVSGTAGTFVATDCVFSAFGAIVLTSGCTMDGGTFSDCGTITQAQAAMTDCVFLDHTTIEGEAFIDSNNLADFSGGTFDNTGGRGHAIKITATGTYAFNDNIFSGYDPTTYETSFDTITDVDDVGEDITITSHPYTTGDAVVYSDEGLSDTIGLTDNAVVYVNSIDVDTISLHLNEGDALNDNARINLTDGSAGQTHKFYGASAMIWNDSGGLVTINVSGGTLVSVRNTSGSTTTVVSSVPLTITVKDTAGVVIENANVAIYDTSNNEIMAPTLTNPSGVASGSHSGGTPLTVSVRVRKGTGGATKYFPVNSPQTISGSGLAVTITMTEDTINTL